MRRHKSQRLSSCAPELAGARKERALASPRFRNGRFHNTAPVGSGLKGNPLPTLGEYFFARTPRTPPTKLPLESPLLAWQTKPQTGMRATWLGHSTVLLEIDGARVLTDPVFGERVSPVSFAGPKRFHPPPVPLSALPPLDAVLISHDHYDHLCYSTILELAKREVPFITSLGVGARLESWGIPAKRIVELDWWEEHVLPGGALSLTATPAQHFSGRGLGDRNLTSWAGWVFRGATHKIFFSGDTGLTEEFKEIGARLGPFGLVMLEVGAWHPSWGDIHLGPENALKALAMLGGGTLLPVHWGTFNLALHAWDEPVETLLRLAGASNTRVVTPRLGAALEPALAPTSTAWWRDI
jgi:L-ascorbate metabolism protein UlaG (beta-lactamase superfamily)